MKHLSIILLSLAGLYFAGCDTLAPALESPDSKVTLSERHIATPTGLQRASEVEPGSYAVNQIVEPGTYEREALNAFAPGPLPQSVSIEPGNSPSFLEQLLSSAGALASTVPGGQPVGVGLLGLAGVAQVWRDRRKRADAETVAKTLGSTLDTALDIVATLPDREQARKIEAQINSAREHFAKSYRATREVLDKLVAETETPSKAPIHAS